MTSGHHLNDQEKLPDYLYYISHFIISINGIPLNKYLNSLPKNDCKKEIISRTLCPKSDRANAHELLELCQRLSSMAFNRDSLAAISPPLTRQSPPTIQTNYNNRLQGTRHSFITN